MVCPLVPVEAEGVGALASYMPGPGIEYQANSCGYAFGFARICKAWRLGGCESIHPGPYYAGTGNRTRTVLSTKGF